MIEGRQTVVICGFGELGQTIANMLEVCRLLMYRAVSTLNFSILRASTARSSMARQLQQMPRRQWPSAEPDWAKRSTLSCRHHKALC